MSTPSTETSIRVTFGIDTVAVCFSRRTLRLKRALDIVAGTLVGIFLTPVLLCLAIAVVLDSRGGALFRQTRLGIQGRPFTMYKFRTMVPGAANMGDGLACYGEDPRVTRVGKFLRRWSLDELPQLWNIITGDMSLVGPRPPVVDELGPLDRLPPEALIRFCVKPGVSGLAQVSGRNELSWPEKIVYDAEYVERLRREGLALDFKIAIGTLGVLFSKRGLYDIKGKNQNLS